MLTLTSVLLLGWAEEQETEIALQTGQKSLDESCLLLDVKSPSQFKTPSLGLFCFQGLTLEIWMWQPFSLLPTSADKNRFSSLSSLCFVFPFVSASVYLHRKYLDPRLFWVCFSAELLSWLTDSALFSSVKGLCITHRQHLGKTSTKHSCWCIWKGDQCWASCYQIHCFLPQCWGNLLLPGIFLCKTGGQPSLGRLRLAVVWPCPLPWS